MSCRLKRKFKMDQNIKAKSLLNALSLEDSLRDFEINCEILMNAGYDLRIERVETEKEFTSVLGKKKFDIVLADFNLHGFDAFGALGLCNDICPDVPFICVSGSIGEETAIELIKQGAVDYVLKDRLERLPFAVKRALDEAKEREKRQLAEKSLRDSEQNYKTLADSGQALVRTAGTDARDNYFNRVWLEFTGHTLEQEIGRGWAEDVHADDRQRCLDFYNGAFERREKFSMEYRLRRYDGEYRWIQDNGSPRYDSNGDFIGYISHCLDVTEHKRVEAVIRSSLAEKEVLLKEVHHRVKNNLMTLIGLIKMQEAKANNEAFSDLLQELESRVRAMAQVHESLHKSKDLARVNLQDYIETMSAHIRAQYGLERDIRFSLQAAGVEVNLDIAIPCGLILNELIANAFKHAFPGDKPRDGEGNCEIGVAVKYEGGRLTLTVADNGVGLPVGLDWEKSETLGLRLIKMLSQQLNGSIELERSTGTIFHLRFAHPPMGT
jgi:PAS domain S-box-containing protein